MKAIITKYHGPTNTRGSRISASDQDGNRISMSYESDLSSENMHDKVAKALCVKMGWTGHSLVRGGFPDSNVYVMLAPWEVVEFSAEEQAEGKARDMARKTTRRTRGNVGASADQPSGEKTEREDNR